MAEAKLPTIDEIAKLPRWARVAFAARCARRALPLFVKHWPNAPRHHVEAVVRAVVCAEYCITHTSDIGHAANDARNAATAAAYEDAACVANAAKKAYDTITSGDPYSVAAAAAAAKAAGVPGASIVREFKLVLERAAKERWTDDTLVPPSAFGPLKVAKSPKSFRLLIETFMSDSADPDEAANRLVSLYEKLNELCLLKYGRGLTVEEFEEYVRAGILLPVGV